MNSKIKSLFETNSLHRERENIALIYDNNYSFVATLIINHCKESGLAIEPHLIGYLSETTLPQDIKPLFLSKKPEIIIIALKQNIWHTPERRIAKYEKGKRLVNLLHPEEPCESYNANLTCIKNVGTQLEHIIKKSKKINIYSKSGTEIEAKIGKVFYENGDYSHFASGGDFPAGEVGFGPVTGSVNGKIVYDFKIQHIGFVRNMPHVIYVKEDKIEILNASEEYKRLVESDNVLNYISEISFGINPIWTEVKNITSIVEEKNIGTIHFGQGSNLSYGSRKGPHFDSVILNPTVLLDGILIMDEGIMNKTYINI